MYTESQTTSDCKDESDEIRTVKQHIKNKAPTNKYLANSFKLPPYFSMHKT